MYELLYFDDFIFVKIVGNKKGLKIIVLILLLFKGLSIDFEK